MAQKRSSGKFYEQWQTLTFHNRDFLNFMANLATVKAKISVKILNQDTDNISNTYATITESLCNESCNLFA
jgi:hypothetical protein